MPSSTSGALTLYRVPLDRGYSDTLQFSSRQAQYNYFNANYSPLVLNQGYKYVDISRKEITVALDITVAQTYNYVRINNPDDSWMVYGFLDDVRSNGANSSCILMYTVDVFQTFMGLYTINDTIVSRETAWRWDPTGAPYVHTMPEPVATSSDYDTGGWSETIENDYYFYLIGSLDKLQENAAGPQTIAGKVPDTINWYLVTWPPGNSSIATHTINGQTCLSLPEFFRVITPTQLASIITISYIPYFPTLRKISDADYEISSIYGYPVALADQGPWAGGHIYYIRNNLGLPTYQELLPELTVQPTITPGASDIWRRESRLLFPPFSHLEMNTGTTEPIRFDFSGFPRMPTGAARLSFQLLANTLIGQSVRTVWHVNNYRAPNLGNILFGNATLIDSNNYSLPIITDTYELWKTTQQYNIVQRVGSTIAATATNPLLGLTTAADLATQNATQQMQPNTIRGASDSIYAALNGIRQANQLSVRLMSQPPEYMQAAGEHFQRFGVSTNRRGTLQKWRSLYDYYQCQAITIRGNFPHNYLEEIRNAYRNGVRIWYGQSAIGDYTLDNTEVYT